MKNKVKLCWLVFIFSLYLFPSLSRAGQEMPFDNPEQTISMDFQDAQIKDILKIFSIQSGLNFIASEDVQERKVTLYLDKVAIKDAMDKLFKANNLAYDLDRSSNIFIVKDLGKPQVQTITKIFYLKYQSVPSSRMEKEKSILSVYTSPASAGMSSAVEGSGGGDKGGAGEGKAVGSNITSAVKELLSQYGKVSEDRATNSLIVTEIPSRMPIIEQLIASLDIPRPQVMLEVEMLDVSKNTVDKLGFEFGSNPFTVILPGGFMRRGAEFFLGNLTLRKTDIADSAAAGSVILGSNYAQLLNFLRTRTDTKYLARPRILTLNNETAEIKIVTNEAVGVIETTSTAEGAATSTSEAERYETGVSLRVTPQINSETGEITMIIIPTVAEAAASTVSFASGGGTKSFKDPEVRTTKSMVRIKDGDTVVLGGLIRNEFSETDKKLPFLGDIPILGALFRSKDKSKDKERELLVFITPHIIKDSDMQFARSRRNSLSNREQNPLSAYDRQKNMQTSLNNFEDQRK